MKRFVLALLLGGLLPFWAMGQNTPTAEATRAPQKYYTIEQVPNVQLENAAQYVTDPQGILSVQERDSLNAISRQLRDSTTSQMAIVILPAIDLNKYDDARDFANQLFNYWKLGEKGTDNGVLVLLLTEPEQREITFEVGYGLEEYLPDRLCKHIQTELMIPEMKKGNYGSRLLIGAVEINKIIRGKSEFANDYIHKKEEEDSFMTKVMLFLLSIIGFLTYLLGYKPLKKIVDDPNLSDYQKYAQLKENNSMWGCGCLFTILFPCLPVGIIYFLMVKRLRRRQLSAIVCDNCGEKNSQQVSTQDDESVTNYFFTCSKCGKVHKESIKKTVHSSSQGSKSSRKDDSYGSSSSYSRSSSSYSRSYGGSSSSSRGSYGGGSSGGGGASTKF
ncbi:TPM domain-containing protein [Capnocytophaga leadbetteri]